MKHMTVGNLNRGLIAVFIGIFLAVLLFRFTEFTDAIVACIGLFVTVVVFLFPTVINFTSQRWFSNPITTSVLTAICTIVLLAAFNLAFSHTNLSVQGNPDVQATSIAATVIAKTQPTIASLEAQVNKLSTTATITASTITTATTGFSNTQTIAVNGTVLRRVKERGVLRCGVNGTVKGLSFDESRQGNGPWTGVEVEYCKIIAQVVLGNQNSVEFVALSTKDGDKFERFNALYLQNSKEVIDVAFRNTSKTGFRDISIPQRNIAIDFGPTIFFDSQRILVHKELKITKISELATISNLKICVLPGTTTEANLAVRLSSIKYEAITRSTLAGQLTNDAVLDKYFSQSEAQKKGEGSVCQAVTSDESQLISRLSDDDPSKYRFLEEENAPLGNELLTPYVAEGDDDWLSIINWSIYATMQAAELNVTRDVARNLQNDSNLNPSVRQLLFYHPLARRYATMGIRPDFVKDVISIHGNYEEILEEAYIQPLRPVFNEILIGVKGLDIRNANNKIAGANKLYDKGGGLLAPPPLGVDLKELGLE